MILLYFIVIDFFSLDWLIFMLAVVVVLVAMMVVVIVEAREKETKRRCGYCKEQRMYYYYYYYSFRACSLYGLSHLSCSVPKNNYLVPRGPVCITTTAYNTHQRNNCIQPNTTISLPGSIRNHIAPQTAGL